MVIDVSAGNFSTKRARGNRRSGLFANGTIPSLTTLAGSCNAGAYDANHLQVVAVVVAASVAGQLFHHFDHEFDADVISAESERPVHGRNGSGYNAADPYSG